MYTLKSIFSSIIEKVKTNQEKKPIYIDNKVNNNKDNNNKDYSTFDQEVITRTKYLLQNKS